MNICLPFMKDFPYNSEINEFTIKYNDLTDNYLDLVKFIEVYSHCRINIELINTGIDTDLILALMKINPNIYLKLDEGYITRVQEFQEKGIKYFFTLQCGTWETLNSAVNAKVSDVYITGDLCFSLPQVGKIVGPDIVIRATLNVAQLLDPFNTNSKIRAFFIRPEDINTYSEYIDTFEFFANNKSAYEVLYTVYTKDKYWYGNLAEIIINLGLDIDSRTLLPDFAKYRLGCGRRCLQGNKCAICERAMSLSYALLEKDLMFTEEFTGE